MVDRREINPKGCVVVDLDNSLIRSNSLIILAKFLSKQLFYKKEYHQLYLLVKVILKRKLKKISHKEMKHLIVTQSQNFLSPDQINEFSKILNKEKNDNVDKLLQKYKVKGYHLLLATAAPDFFIPYFLKNLKFTDIDYIATPYNSSVALYIENNGVVKLQNVVNFLENNNYECEAVVTDHEDDLPLILKFPSKIYLVNPSYKTLEIIRNELRKKSLPLQNIKILK